MINLNTVKTATPAINWLIERVKVTDFSDKHGCYLIGAFAGTIPYVMLCELRDIQKRNGGYLYRADNGEYTINAHFTNGQYKATVCRVWFHITLTQNEDLAPE